MREQDEKKGERNKVLVHERRGRREKKNEERMRDTLRKEIKERS